MDHGQARGEPDRRPEVAAVPPLGSRGFWLNLGRVALVPIFLTAAWLQVNLIAGLFGRPWANAIDYKLYRIAADIGLRHGWSHIYDRGLQRQAILPLWPRAGWPASWHSADPFWTPMVSPPPVAWLAAPFNALPLPAAAAIWTALVGVAILAMALLAAPPSPLWKGGFAGLLLITWATGLALVSGNVVVLIALGVVVAWRLLEGGRPVWAGVVLGLVTLKPFVILGVPVFLFLLGWRRTAIAWAVTAGLLALASLLSLGGHGLTEYRQLLAFVSTFPGERGLSLWGLPLPLPLVAILAAAVVLITLAVAWRIRAGGAAAPIGLAVLGSLLVAPYLNAEDFVLLVPAGLLLLRSSPSIVLAGAAVALILAATPASQGYLWPEVAVATLIVVVLAVRSRPAPRTAAA